MAKRQTAAKSVKKEKETGATRTTAATKGVTATAVRLLTQGADDAKGHGAVKARALAATAAVAAAKKPVVFACSNSNCVVGITAGDGVTIDDVNIVFVGTGGTLMQTGSYPIFWRVQGSGDFTVTIQSGGSLSSPIDSTAPDAGTRTITVSA